MAIYRQQSEENLIHKMKAANDSFYSAWKAGALNVRDGPSTVYNGEIVRRSSPNIQNSYSQTEASSL